MRKLLMIAVILGIVMLASTALASHRRVESVEKWTKNVEVAGTGTGTGKSIPLYRDVRTSSTLPDGRKVVRWTQESLFSDGEMRVVYNDMRVVPAPASTTTKAVKVKAPKKRTYIAKPKPQQPQRKMVETLAVPIPSASKCTTHKVVRGENLTVLAKKLGTTPEMILALNKKVKNPSLIKVGWELKVPDVRKVQVASALEALGAKIIALAKDLPIVPILPPFLLAW